MTTIEPPSCSGVGLTIEGSVPTALAGGVMTPSEPESLSLSEPAPSGTELRLGEKVVGRLGSVVVSPSYGPIGLALIRREAAVGDTVAADGATALIVDVPFSR